MPAADVNVAVAYSDVIARGYSGDLTWMLSDSGLLMFSGAGKMRNYTHRNQVPWNAYRPQITSIVISQGVRRISPLTFVDMVNLETLAIPDSITEIGAYAFKNCAKLTELVLPEGLTKLNESAFYGCTGLTEVVIPGSLATVGNYAFKKCSGLADLTLSSGVVTLGDSAFYGIAAAEVLVPETVEAVNEYCFARSGLAEITFTGNAPAIGEGAFHKIVVTAVYPAGNATWTEAVMQNYGGTLTWTAR